MITITYRLGIKERKLSLIEKMSIPIDLGDNRFLMKYAWVETEQETIASSMGCPCFGNVTKQANKILQYYRTLPSGER